MYLPQIGGLLLHSFMLRFNFTTWKESAMLILTRHKEESVIINGDIKITVLGMDRGYVKLGFEAPDNVKIVREELLEDDNSTCATLMSALY